MKKANQLPCAASFRLFGVILACMQVISTIELLAAGIPEPPVVLFGTVTNITAGGSARLVMGTLVWRFRTNGITAATVSSVLSNLNDQFSFAVQVPCEMPTGTQQPTSNTLQLVPPFSPPIVYAFTEVSVDNRPARLVQSTPGTLTGSTANRGLVQRVDLLLSFDPIDYDRNGLPDDWENRFFGHLRNDPNADPDHDGMSNMAEYLAGTDPADSQSLFKFISISQVANGRVDLAWFSQPGKRYTLLRGNSLLLPRSSYAVVQTNIGATPPANHLSDTVSGGTFFYQLKLE